MTTNQATSNEKKTQNKNSFWRILFRWVLVLLIGAALAILIYLGGTRVYQQIISNIDSNHESITDIDGRVVQIETLLDDRLPQYNQRITKLESDKKSNSEKISEIETGLQDVEDSIENYEKELEKLEDLNDSIDELSTSVATILTRTPVETQAINQASVTSLSHHVDMLRAAELLSRSRIYILQNNYGLATQDIEKAREILFILQEEASQNETLMLSMEIEKLDNALELLPGSPVQASSEIEGAWEMLVIGLVEQTASIPMDFSTITETLTPTPTPTITDTAPTTTEETEHDTATPLPTARRTTIHTPEASPIR